MTGPGSHRKLVAGAQVLTLELDLLPTVTCEVSTDPPRPGVGESGGESNQVVLNQGELLGSTWLVMGASWSRNDFWSS